MAAVVVSVEKLSKSFNEKELFDELTFGIDQGQKIALVGVNGCGKSTLLNIVAGKETQDNGNVSFQKDIKISYLNQSPDLSGFHTILDSIFDENHEEGQLLKSYHSLIDLPNPSSAEQEKIQVVIEQIDSRNAWDYEYRVKEILGKLGLHDLNQQISSLSGGQRKRIALARVLLDQPDFLILDEPTNHLDLTVIEWLEDFLSTQKLALLMVTHDRYFLDKVCTGIIEMEAGQLYRYAGNYSNYLEKKAEKEAWQQEAKSKAQNLMRKELDWMRRQPKARGTKAKYRVDAFYDLKDKASVDLRKNELNIKIAGKRQGKKILELDKIGKSFDGKPIFDDFSYIFTKGERVGIVGNNGTGKSTLLNVLTGKIVYDTGTMDKGLNTEIGYYTQDEIAVDGSKTVIEVIKDIAEVIQLADGSTVTASQLLGQFLFPPKVQFSHVSKLSGGEKRRLQLLRVLMANPNFLILDEPTNDLDIVTLNILEEYLQNFPGCLVLVSHDRYFMDRLVEKLFVFDESDLITIFNGNYTDYRLALAELKLDKPEKINAADTAPKAKKDQSKKLNFKEKREFESLESEISRLGNRKNEISNQLNSGETDHAKLTDWSSELDKISKSLDAKEMRWLELSENV